MSNEAGKGIAMIFAYFGFCFLLIGGLIGGCCFYVGGKYFEWRQTHELVIKVEDKTK